MKLFSITCLILGLFVCVPAMAADDQIEESESTEVQFLKNFDQKIKALENYTVTYGDAHSRPTQVKRNVEATDFDIQLIPTKLAQGN